MGEDKVECGEAKGEKKKTGSFTFALFLSSLAPVCSLPLTPLLLSAHKPMSFFQRVVHHLVNEVLVSGLANRCG